MRVLVVDRNELYRCEGNAKAVVVLYNWGYGVVAGQGMYEYCHDLDNLLSQPDVSERRLRAIRLWLERRSNNSDEVKSGHFNTRIAGQKLGDPSRGLSEATEKAQQDKNAAPGSENL